MYKKNGSDLVLKFNKHLLALKPNNIYNTEYIIYHRRVRQQHIPEIADNQLFLRYPYNLW